MSNMSPDEEIRIQCLQMSGGDMPQAAAMYQWITEQKRGGKPWIRLNQFNDTAQQALQNVINEVNTGQAIG